MAADGLTERLCTQGLNPMEDKEGKAAPALSQPAACGSAAEAAAVADGAPSSCGCGDGVVVVRWCCAVVRCSPAASHEGEDKRSGRTGWRDWTQRLSVGHLCSALLCGLSSAQLDSTQSHLSLDLAPSSTLSLLCCALHPLPHRLRRRCRRCWALLCCCLSPCRSPARACEVVAAGVG